MILSLLEPELFLLAVLPVVLKRKDSWLGILAWGFVVAFMINLLSVDPWFLILGSVLLSLIVTRMVRLIVRGGGLSFLYFLLVIALYNTPIFIYRGTDIVSYFGPKVPIIVLSLLLSTLYEKS